MLLVWEKFSGVQPKMSPRRLGMTGAQVANNTDLTSRTVKGWKTPTTVMSGLTPASVSTIYRFGQTLTSDTQYWFHWTADVDVTKTAVASDSSERTYITHPTLGPMVTNNSLALTTISSTYALVSNIVTVTTLTPHSMTAGESCYLATSTGALPSGTYTIATVTSPTVFTVNYTAANTSGNLAFSRTNTYPYHWHKLGVPAPTAAPTTVIQTQGSTSGSQETRMYCYTYVTGFGEEGPPSPISADLTLYTSGATVRVSGLPTTAPSGYGNVTGKRIYRTLTGSSTTAFQFVAEVSLSTATYDDGIAGVDLQETIPSATYAPPVSGCFGITSMANGIALLFQGYDIWASESYLPFTYPNNYRQTVDYPIVGGKAIGSSAIVLTTGFPYLLTGSDPSALTLTKLDVPQSCVSKRSIVAFTGGVAYASPDGIMFITTTGQVTNVTESVFNRQTWQALVPSSIVGCMQDNRYYGFYNNGTTSGGFVLDPSEQDACFSFIDTQATAGFSDLVQDTMYLKSGADIIKWNAGATPMSATWHSGVYEYTRPINPTVAEVRATSDAYPLTLKLYADGTLKHTQTVTDSGAFWLPGGYLADTVEFEINTSGGEVTAVFIADSVRDLQGV